MFRKMPVPFFYILLTGLALGLVIGFKSLIPYLYFGDISEYDWIRSALPHIVNYLFWPFLVPFIHQTSQKFPVIWLAPFNAKLQIIGVSFVIPLIHELVTTFIYFYVLNEFDVYKLNQETFSYILAAFPSVYIGRVVEFWIIYGLFIAFGFYKKYKEKQAELSTIEAQLNRTKLAVLKMQLQPHFLFNALNSISSLMDIDIKRAQTVTAKLGELLRGILDQDQRIFISLEEELNYVETYLDIEKIRFEDRLSIEYEIEETSLSFQVPILLIQPLVENAIKHGVAPISRPVVIKIRTFLEGKALHFEVEDNGAGQNRTSDKSLQKGIGLRNIRERLDQLYKDEYSLVIQTSINHGFSIQVSIPFKNLDL